MGAACCVAAKDRTIVSVPRGQTMQRHVRNSPSWSFRWDNRGRVAGEETTSTWLSDADGDGRNDRVGVKFGTMLETAFASEEGSSLDSFRSLQWQKSPVSEGNADQSTSRNLVEVKESMDYPSVSHSPPIKLSPSVPSVSSLSTSPLSSQSRLLPPKLTPSRWHYRSPRRHVIGRTSDTRIPGYKSPTLAISEEASLSLAPSWGNESTRGSDGGGSSDSWSIPFFSDFMATRRERWSFDSENSAFFGREKITTRSSGRNSRSPSVDLQTCGVCSKLLTERSSWGQKLISTNELAVVSVLTCGHVYHAECLEYMTSEINKYDPACPICTFGEKRSAKMCEKALKAEMDLKGRKRSKKRVVDSGMSSDIVFDHPKCSGVEESDMRLSTSGSAASSLGKPFLKRRFSFSSKSSRLLSGNQSGRRKSFFWARSSKN